MKTCIRFLLILMFFTVAGLLKTYAQPVTLKKAEIRPLAGAAKDTPQFSVLLSVSGSAQISVINIEFFSDNAPGKSSVEVKQVTEDNKHYILSSGARFPVGGDDIVFNIQPPGSYSPDMRQARITIASQSGSTSDAVTITW
jgi:hypothetical protein